MSYLRHVGYAGVTACVMSDGSTLYPSDLLQPTPRHDRGIYGSLGQDPKRKDVLEMMFRLFDREELTLIPLLRFATPLPALERQRQDVGITLVNRRGKSWVRDQGSHQGLAPYYNPLDPRVQQAMEDVVAELLVRYADHRSFGGVTISMTPDGYTHLPDADWGMDAETLQRFSKDAGVSLPSDTAMPLTEYVWNERREEWLQWRSEQLAAFYERLGQRVGESNSNAQLYLAMAELSESIPMQRHMRPSLIKPLDYRKAMAELGLDQTTSSANLQVPRPHAHAPAGDLAAQGVNMETNRSSYVDKFFAKRRSTSSVFYHHPQRVPLPSFDQVSPFRGRETVLLSNILPAADINRKRIVHAIASQDTQTIFDGGWMIPLGQEQSVVDLIAAFQQLPARRFETVDFGHPVPVIVRTLTNSDQTYVYLLNDSPWPVDTRLGLVMPRCRFESVTSRKINPIQYENGKPRWNVQLKPYDMVAVRFSHPNVKVDEIFTEPNAEVKLALKKRIDLMTDRIRALRAPVLTQLPNRSFEKDGLDDWIIEPGELTRVDVDKDHAHEGKQSVRLQSNGDRVAIRTRPFDPPRAGRMWVSTYFRAEDLSSTSRNAVRSRCICRFIGPYSARSSVDRLEFREFGSNQSLQNS